MESPEPKKHTLKIPAILFFSILLFGCIALAVLVTAYPKPEAKASPGAIQPGTEKYRPVCFENANEASLSYDAPLTMYTAIELKFPNEGYEAEVNVSAGSLMARDEKAPQLLEPKGKACRFESGQAVYWNPMDVTRTRGRHRRYAEAPVDSAVLTFTAYEGGVKKASGRISMTRAGKESSYYTAKLLELVSEAP